LTRRGGLRESLTRTAGLRGSPGRPPGYARTAPVAQGRRIQRGVAEALLIAREAQVRCSAGAVRVVLGAEDQVAAGALKVAAIAGTGGFERAAALGAEVLLRVLHGQQFAANNGFGEDAHGISPYPTLPSSAAMAWE